MRKSFLIVQMLAHLKAYLCRQLHKYMLLCADVSVDIFFRCEWYVYSIIIFQLPKNKKNS